MKKIFILSLLITTSIFFVCANIAMADCSNTSTDDDTVCIENPLAVNGTDPTPQIIIGRVINATMGLVGSLALAMFIYGGFVWMLAAGNDQRVQKGKEILTWATIGLIVIFSSYALVRVIFTGLGVNS